MDFGNGLHKNNRNYFGNNDYFNFVVLKVKLLIISNYLNTKFVIKIVSMINKLKCSEIIYYQILSTR